MVSPDHDIKIEIGAYRSLTRLRRVIQPASIDVRLGNDFRVFRNADHVAIDPELHQPDRTEQIIVSDGDAFVLHPGQFVLGTTLERICVPDDVLGKLEGKSSLGRLGLMIHSTAGYIDPGWNGHITLELSNVANLPIRFAPACASARSASAMSSPSTCPDGAPGLGSHYQGQVGATAGSPLTRSGVARG